MRVAKDLQITLYLCIGDPLQTMTLQRISAREAKHIVILPNDSHHTTATMNSADASAVLMTQAFEAVRSVFFLKNVCFLVSTIQYIYL